MNCVGLRIRTISSALGVAIVKSIAGIAAASVVPGELMLVLIRDSMSNALSLEHLSLHEGCPTLALRPEFKRPSGLSM